MDDLQAKMLLGAVVGKNAPVEALQGMQAIGLLISNYGHLGGHETHHWLGYPQSQPFGEKSIQVKDGFFPVYDSPIHGISVFSELILNQLGRDVLTSRDVGRLAWSLLEKGIVPAEPSVSY